MQPITSLQDWVRAVAVLTGKNTAYLTKMATVEAMHNYLVYLKLTEGDTAPNMKLWYKAFDDFAPGWRKQVNVPDVE